MCKAGYARLNRHDKEDIEDSVKHYVKEYANDSGRRRDDRHDDPRRDHHAPPPPQTYGGGQGKSGSI